MKASSGACWCSARQSYSRPTIEQVREINLFGGVLLIQSLPFLAAAVLAGLEGSRVNDFAFWRGLEPRLAARLRPARIAEVAIIGGQETSCQQAGRRRRRIGDVSSIDDVFGRG